MKFRPHALIVLTLFVFYLTSDSVADPVSSKGSKMSDDGHKKGATAGMLLYEQAEKAAEEGYAEIIPDTDGEMSGEDSAVETEGPKNQEVEVPGEEQQKEKE